MSVTDLQQPIKLGVLCSTTGMTSDTGSLVRSATQFAVSEINQAGGVDGRELSIVYFDPGSDPVYYRYLTEELITQHGVKVIFGCYRSSTRIAVKPIVERHNCTLCYPAQYEGFEYSSNIIYGGAVANQNCAQLADFITRDGAARVFLVGSDYIWPRESARTMSEMIASRNGEVVGQAFFKFDALQEQSVALMQEIKNLQPDVIYCNLVGPSLGHFYRAYSAAGLDPAKMPIASLTTSEADLLAMGPRHGEGHITSAPYFQSVNTSENLETLERFSKWIGRPFVTNMVWEAAFTQVHLVATALAQVGTDDAESLRTALLGNEFNAPQGRIRLDAENGHTYLWPRIGRANAAGQFDILEESTRAVKPDPYLTSHQSAEWGMRIAN